MVYEIIRWISLILLWVAMALNIAVMIRGAQLNKKMKVAVMLVEEIHASYGGRPPVKFCHECEYSKEAKPNEKGFLICPASGMEITSYDYCSYFAEMKEASDEEN